MGKITINEMNNSLYDYAQAVSDENLMTENKTIVGAINEIYGKNLIADSIGEPLNNTDTFTKMSNDINSLLSTFKTNMMNAGAVVESSDKFKQLIDKIKGLTEGEGNKGIQFAEGIETIIVDYIGSGDFRTPNEWEPVKQISINVGFKPVYILLVSEEFQFCQYEGTTYYSIPQGYFELNNMSYCNINYTEYGGKMVRDKYWYNDGTSDGSEFIFDRRTEINNTGFDLFYRFLNVWSGYAIQNLYANVPLKWIAIGVGEEDTTLRDSLASILQEEGVEVTEEDDMASLISKTDNEFQENTTILYNKMKDANYNVDSSMNMDALLNELTFKTIIEGKVAQSPSTSENSLVYSVSGLDFTPSLVYVTLKGVYEQCDEIESVYYNSITLNNRQSFVGESKYNTIKVNIKNNGFNLILNSQDGSTFTGGLGWTSINGISYVAIR